MAPSTPVSRLCSILRVIVVLGAREQSNYESLYQCLSSIPAMSEVSVYENSLRNTRNNVININTHFSQKF